MTQLTDKWRLKLTLEWVAKDEHKIECDRCHGYGQVADTDMFNCPPHYRESKKECPKCWGSGGFDPKPRPEIPKEIFDKLKAVMDEYHQRGYSPKQENTDV